MKNSVRSIFFGIAFLSSIECYSQEDHSLRNLIMNFPVGELQELVQPIDPVEYQSLLQTGHSKNWIMTGERNKPNAVEIQNLRSKDNMVRFFLLPGHSEKKLLAVQQVNAESQQTGLWIINPGDHQKIWKPYSLPSWSMKDFVSDQVLLPAELDLPVNSYLAVEFHADAIQFGINTFLFLKEVENYFAVSATVFEHNYVKYTYLLMADGAIRKKNDVDFEPLLVATALLESDYPLAAEDSELIPVQASSVTASSYLPSQSSHSYQALNLTDKDQATVWSEGTRGHGINEWVEFIVLNESLFDERFFIRNGYSKDRSHWLNNNRVKKMKCLVNGKAVASIRLQDEMGDQYFSVGPKWLKQPITFRKGDQVRFIIEEVYDGVKYDDTVISDFIPLMR